MLAAIMAMAGATTCLTTTVALEWNLLLTSALPTVFIMATVTVMILQVLSAQ